MLDLVLDIDTNHLYFYINIKSTRFQLQRLEEYVPIDIGYWQSKVSDSAVKDGVLFVDEGSLSATYLKDPLQLIKGFKPFICIQIVTTK